MLLALLIFLAGDGGTPGTFLNYGLTPRTLAMGKSFTGLADDAEAGYYNPAGLVQLMSHDIKACHSQLYGGFRMEYLGYAFPTRRFGFFGFTLINHGAENIESRVSLTDIRGTYNFRQNAILFSYAYPAFRDLAVGGNIKVVTSNIATFGAVGLGADLGFFLFPKSSITFGGVVQNLFGPNLIYHATADKFPLTFRLGAGVRLYRGQVILSGDLVKPGENSLAPHLGLEFKPLSLLTVRGGMDKNELNAGCGVHKDWGKFSVGADYAALFHHRSNYLLPVTHKIGVWLNFGGFRTWVEASAPKFSPSPTQKDNVVWLDLHYITKKAVKRWQLVVKNSLGEIVRTFSGWEKPPMRLTWDGLDDVGRIVPDGDYFYEIIVIDAGSEKVEFADFLTRIISMGPRGTIEMLPPKEE